MYQQRRTKLLRLTTQRATPPTPPTPPTPLQRLTRLQYQRLHNALLLALAPMLTQRYVEARWYHAG